MPSMIISTKPAGDRVLHHSSSYQASNEVPNSVLSCRNALSNGFRMWKEKRCSMGHPGHYFHRTLATVTGNSRSQSLPSCVEDKKKCLQDKCEEDISLHPCQTNDCPNVSNRVLWKEDDTVCNQAWFKTWPERGSDKFVPQNNNDMSSKLHTNTQVTSSNAVEILQEENVWRNTKSNSSNCSASVNTQPTDCASGSLACVVNGHNSLCCRPSTCSALSEGCDCAEIRMCKSPEAVQNQVKYSIRLEELLQTMPLAYSPITRQLHIINQNDIHTPLVSAAAKEEVKGVGNSSISKREGVVRNGLKSLESISEEKSSRVNSKSDFECIVGNNSEDSLSYESPHSTLQRIGVGDNSLSRTDASSFSSIVSSLSESSPSTNEDPAQGTLLDPENSSTSQASHDFFCSGDANCFDENGAKPKRRGISSFFSRNVFSWKLLRESVPTSGGSGGTVSNCNTAPSWKLFGKATARPRPEAVEEDRVSGSSSPCGAKQYEDLVASSSALILHQRPSNLPAKSQDEEQKHRHEYQRMVEAVRKKELKEAKLRKKQLQQQLKQEEQLATAARVWSGEILPKWEIMKTSRKTQDLWWQGIPPSVRGKVWRLAIGNDLNITHQLYDICVSRAQERLKSATEMQEGKSESELDNPDKEASVELIQLDIARTFPNLCIFQKGGPYYDILHSLLGAYVCYRPDVGYVQGMSFIAAVLILNLEAADAFVCFANLLNQPCHMAFFRLNQPLMQAYYATYDDFFRENLPRLFAHFMESSLSPDLYLLDWLYTVFAKAMPLDVACRIWDVFLRDGEEFLFKTALGVLHLHQDTLLQLDFLHGAQFLTKLPDDLAADHLFKSIESIRMNVGKLRFTEVLASHIENSCEPS